MSVLDAARIRSLDGLRAVSVAGVFLAGYHWAVPFGWIGVLVFYVLSGFLITQILLVERDALLTDSAEDAGKFFRRFYFRRTLRIFPLYFAYLFSIEVVYALIAVPAAWSEVRPFAFSYLINFGMIAGSVDSADAYGHLWTLSVEEQFYLLWPLAVWFCSRVLLLRIAIAAVVFGPVVRFVSMWLFDLDIGQLYVSSFSHLDAFAVGAVIAILGAQRTGRNLLFAFIALALSCAVGLEIARATGTSFRTLGYPEGLHLGYAYLWGYTSLNLCAGLVVMVALRGELSWLGTPTLAYVGRISYGIYLFQRPVKGVYLEHVEPILLAAITSRWVALSLGALLCALAAVGLAALSYRYFETPILRWRDRRYPPLRPEILRTT